METTYYKDAVRSFMVMACPPEAETNGYQYRMLEMNRIEGLLPCSIRHIDGVKYLYYDISGKQNLKTLYEDRKIPGTELFRLLKAADEVTGSLAGYLLDDQQIVLDEKQIFYDFQTGNYWFTYYPGSTQTPTVFHFLANAIDASDKKAAAAAYRLWSLAGGDRQALREALREEASDENREAHSSFAGAAQRGPTQEEAVKEVLSRAEYNRKEYEKDEYGGGEYDLKEYGTKKRGRKESGGNSHSRKEKEEKKKAALPDADVSGRKGREKPAVRLWVKISVIVLLAAGAGGLLAVQYFVYMTQRERRLCIAGAALLLLAAAVLTAETVMKTVRNRRKEKEEEEKRVPVYVKSNESDLPVYSGGESREDYLLGEETNTVRFSEQTSTGRLYGRERGSRIDLRTLPVTVGKAQSFADAVLDDPSVSRVHARIYKGEEGGIEIRDLGSTNGTWINGVMIPPNERVRVQRGDEVKFGNLEYEYR